MSWTTVGLSVAGWYLAYGLLVRYGPRWLWSFEHIVDGEDNSRGGPSEQADRFFSWVFSPFWPLLWVWRGWRSVWNGEVLLWFIGNVLTRRAG